MTPTHCCDSMKYHAVFKCQTCQDEYECADSIIIYSPKFDEYGLIIHDGGNSKISIQYCPFCGVKLPESKRDQWVVILESKGINPWEDEIPAQYETYGWWITAENK